MQKPPDVADSLISKRVSRASGQSISRQPPVAIVRPLELGERLIAGTRSAL
jgi:hypothetical protein